MGIPLQLLIIEDSADDTDLLVRKISSGGYQVSYERVETEGALRLALEGKRWDVVISDYRLPKMDALRGLAILREREPDLPFLIVSGAIGEETAVEALKAGASDYIMKDKLGRLVFTISRELREAANREKLRRNEERLRQAQRMELIGQFAGAVAHGFNNALATILMHCDLLEESLGNPEQISESVRQVGKAAERAAHLSRQLLAFSGRQVINPKVIDLNSSLAEKVETLKRSLPQRISLEISLSKDVACVKADISLMEQVLLRIIATAIDSMPKDGKLKIRTSNVDLDELRNEQCLPPGRYFLLTVEDTGSGLESVVQERVFEPFNAGAGREDSSLGLASAYGIVKQHGGFISLKSTPGKGTTFQIYLPRLDAKPDPGLSLKTKEVSRKDARGKILLLDDDVDFRTVIAAALSKAGYEVQCPADPDEAMVTTRPIEGFDLLITGITLRRSNGPELAGSLVAQNPKLKILFISGHIEDKIDGYEKIRERAAFLQKPFSLGQLLEKIQSF